MADVPAPVLRDIFFIWFYVTMTRLDDIDKVNPADPNDPRVPVETIISDLAQKGIAMNETNMATVKTFYAGIVANKGFKTVRGVLRSHDVLDGIWIVDPPHPEVPELQSVFIPPGI